MVNSIDEIKIKKKHSRKVMTIVVTLIVFAFLGTNVYAETQPDVPEGDVGGAEGGANTMTYDYTGTLAGSLTANAKEVTVDGKTYSATTADKNTALVQAGGTLAITDATLKKSGSDSNGDNCNFYGINSILLATGEDSMTYISKSDLTADSTGSNGLFATDKATIYARDNTIKTTSDNSRGLDATYDGTIIADKLTIDTKGNHSAAVATDRGGGNISLTNSEIKTAGSGSPLLYSTGDIEVDNVTGTATGSQIAGMEGLNKIIINNSKLTSTLTKATASDPVADGIILYQSTSGDAESTTGDTATFQAVDSTLKSEIESGTMFYITNTDVNVVLKNTKLDFDSSKAKLFTVEGNNSNNWGTAGSNGGTAKVSAIKEKLEGDISVDTISSLDLYLLSKTTYTGSTSITTNSVNTSGTSAPITVNVDKSSKWVVTGNSTVTNLNVKKGAKIVDKDGKKVTIKAAGKTVVEGTSKYTITVTGTYSTKFTTDDTNKVSEDYIDRTDFDAYFSVNTAFGVNGSKNDEQVEAKEKGSHTGYYIAGCVVLAAAGIAAWQIIRRKRK